MKLAYWLPLIGYLVPTLVIGYGVVIPASCIAGVNELTLGFASAVAGAAVTYVIGIGAVLRDSRNAAPVGAASWLWRRIGAQARKPSNRFGAWLFRIMAWETRRDNLEAVRRLDIADSHAVLEIGFGHGRTLGTLLERTPHGRVTGIDWSDDAVARAASRFT